MASIRQQTKNFCRVLKTAKPKQKITIVLFDHFGVVGVDPLQKWQLDHQLDEAQLEVVHAICDLIDAGELELFPFYSKLGELTSQTGMEVKRELDNNSGYNQDLLAIIRQLRHIKNVRIGLLSNAHRSLHKSLWKDKVHPLFDDVLTSQEVSQVSPKPNKDFFLHAINRLGGTPGKTLFFDDRIQNIEGAIATGLDAHVFTSAAQCRVDLHKHRIFD